MKATTWRLAFYPKEEAEWPVLRLFHGRDAEAHARKALSDLPLGTRRVQLAKLNDSGWEEQTQ